MSQVAVNQPADYDGQDAPAHVHDPALRRENITLEPAQVGLAWKALVGLGVVGIAVAIIGIIAAIARKREKARPVTAALNMGALLCVPVRPGRTSCI